jgi:hypothetical protein
MQKISQQISDGHNNVKHMIHRMRKSNPNGHYKIKHRTHRIHIKTYPGWTWQYKAYGTSDGREQSKKTRQSKS